MKKVLKLILLVLVVAFVVIQFVNIPDRTVLSETTEDDITKHAQVPENVHNILKRSCYDCHSGHTNWPWYSHIAPVSWLVADDVVKGRKKMNFSEWGKIPDAKKEARLNEVCEQTKSDEMPLPNYLIIHKEAVLTPEDKEILCKWTEAEIKKLEEQNNE